MTTFTATYSPDDNKIRLYASQRLDAETYARVKAAGFKWAPKQELFVAPTWSPNREDLAIELAGEIGDDDSSLVERAEERADRFEVYGEKRLADAERDEARGRLAGGNAHHRSRHVGAARRRGGETGSSEHRRERDGADQRAGRHVCLVSSILTASSRCCRRRSE